MVHDPLAMEVHREDVGQLLHEDVSHLQGPHYRPVVLGLQHGGNVAVGVGSGILSAHVRLFKVIGAAPSVCD